MNGVILPGARIGVLGSGQLGRMFALAARQMGYRVHVLSPLSDSPTGQVADEEVTAAYDDENAVSEFAQGVDVLTFEFENVLEQTTSIASRHTPVRPNGNVLHTTQNRLREKKFLCDAGLDVAPFQAIRNPDDIQRAAHTSQFPAVLKTTAWGYDGKGQVKINRAEGLHDAWESLGCSEAILEEFVDFKCEISLVAARAADGTFASFAPVLNTHSDHILDISVSPCGQPDMIVRTADEMARTVFEQLQVVGVLCVEFFVTHSDQLLINELAPRPHNSGHLTIDAHATSQFEQQVRAICGLPLGATTQVGPAAMANLLGDIWLPKGVYREPNWFGALSDPQVKLHLYGKTEPRAGRKMGHITAIEGSTQQAVDTVSRARQRLSSDGT